MPFHKFRLQCQLDWVPRYICWGTECALYASLRTKHPIQAFGNNKVHGTRTANNQFLFLIQSQRARTNQKSYIILFRNICFFLLHFIPSLFSPLPLSGRFLAPKFDSMPLNSRCEWARACERQRERESESTKALVLSWSFGLDARRIQVKHN